MSLLENMLILQAWGHAERMGTHETTPDGWRVFCDRMDSCVVQVEQLLRLATTQQLAALREAETSAPAREEKPVNVVIFPGIRRERMPPGTQAQREAFAGDVEKSLAEIHRMVVEDARSGALGPRTDGDVA